MSLGIIIKAPEGLVLAAESRVTLSTPTGNGNEVIHVNFDNATKILKFSNNRRIGVVTYGQAAIGIRTPQTFVPEFENAIAEKSDLKVLQFAEELSAFFMNQWQKSMPKDYKGPNMTLNVAGFDKGDSYGKVYTIDIPRSPKPIEQSPAVNGQVQFGITWGGQREIVDRLVLGCDHRLLEMLAKEGVIDPKDPKLMFTLQKFQLPMPIAFMPLQDCVDLATLFIETTIRAQSLTVGIRGCGGPIDVAIITKDNDIDFIQEKKITANH